MQKNDNELVHDYHSDYEKYTDTIKTTHINDVDQQQYLNHFVLNNNTINHNNNLNQINEKNFKDLNKSLSILASRRIAGRSSSDNDAKVYINNNNNQHHYNGCITTTPVNLNAKGIQRQQLQYQQQQLNSINFECFTPFNPIKANKLCQTSIPKYLENIPKTCYVNQDFAKKNGNTYNINHLINNISLHDIHSKKYHRSPSCFDTQKPKVTNQITNTICHSELNTPLIMKSVYTTSNNQRDYQHYFDTNYYNNDIDGDDNDNDERVSVVNGDEILDNENLKGKNGEGIDLEKRNNGNNNKRNVKDDKTKFEMRSFLDHKTLIYDKVTLRNYINNTANDNRKTIKFNKTSEFNYNQSILTPAFKIKKSPTKKTNYIYTLQDHIDQHTKSKLDTQEKPKASNHKTTNLVNNNTQPDHHIKQHRKHHSNYNQYQYTYNDHHELNHINHNTNIIENSRISIDNEGQGALDLNKINDGVQYTQGGVGINNTKRVNKGESKQQRMSLGRKVKEGVEEACEETCCVGGVEGVGGVGVDEKDEMMLDFRNSLIDQGNTKVIKDALHFLKQDIIQIKKDIETRKLSYNELNKFVSLYENDINISGNNTFSSTHNYNHHHNSSNSIHHHNKQDSFNIPDLSKYQQQQKHCQRSSSNFNTRYQDINGNGNNTSSGNGSGFTTNNTSNNGNYNSNGSVKKSMITIISCNNGNVNCTNANPTTTTNNNNNNNTSYLTTSNTPTLNKNIPSIENSNNNNNITNYNLNTTNTKPNTDKDDKTTKKIFNNKIQKHELLDFDKATLIMNDQYKGNNHINQCNHDQNNDGFSLAIQKKTEVGLTKKIPFYDFNIKLNSNDELARNSFTYDEPLAHNVDYSSLMYNSIKKPSCCNYETTMCNVF